MLNINFAKSYWHLSFDNSFATIDIDCCCMCKKDTIDIEITVAFAKDLDFTTHLSILNVS
jgi:hypothetical protein